MKPLLGLTGGIGAGKSTVADSFRLLGIPVFSADQSARQLMDSDPDLMAAIKSLFGHSIYSAAGALDRRGIAEIVFADRLMLDKLNALVHPAVRRDLHEWMEQPLHETAPYLLEESAILLEENLDSYFFALILVCAPEEIRIRRVMDRDKVSRETVEKRMAQQWPDARKIPLSDYVIFNDGQRNLSRQVIDIDQMIRARLS